MKHNRAYLMLGAGSALLLSLLLMYCAASFPAGPRGGSSEGAPEKSPPRLPGAARLKREGNRSEGPAAKTAGPALVRPPVASGQAAAEGAADRIPDEYVLRFGKAADLQRFAGLAQAKGAAVLGVLDRWNVLRLRGLSAEDLADLLTQGVTPLEIENNLSVRAPTYPVERGDEVPFLDGALHWLGVHGDNSTWGSGVTVAILDTGVAPHPALNPASISRISLLQDGSGAAGDYAGHATAIASILAGTSAELHGVSPAAHLLSIQVMGSDGVGDAFTLAQGIVTAVDQGAAVLNLSLGSRGDCYVLRQAVEYAIAQGVAVVAAAGNEGTDRIDYPARYPGVVAVSAVDATGQHADYANRGEQITTAGPGEGVYTAWTDGQVVSFSGTSAAVPFVAGALASLLSENPDLSAADAVALLVRCADDAGAPGPDPEYGRGILDLGRIQDRDQAGILDAALSSHYLDNANATDQAIPVLVCAQNRGTETLPQLQISTLVDGVPGLFQFGPVNVGETVYGTLSVSASALRENGAVAIASEVTIPGGTDARPANNARKTMVVLKQPGQPAGKTP